MWLDVFDCSLTFWIRIDAKYFHIVYYICDRIQAISSVFPGMSKAEQMSLCGFAKKMENEIFLNARTKVIIIDFCRFFANTGLMLSRGHLSISMISIFISPNTIIWSQMEYTSIKEN